jgi:DNA invertase Pin-like site-specific DNA recombinase
MIYRTYEAVAEFEREIIRERANAGIAAARSRGSNSAVR